MKLLHVETGRFLYGGGEQVLYLLRGLAARGVDNLLVCTAGSAIAAPAAEHAQVRVLPMRGDLDLSFVPRLARLIRAEQPDAVHLHSRRGADVLGALAARACGRPCVLSRRVDNSEPRAWAALKYRLYDAVIPISEAIAEVLRKGGVPPAKIHCVRSAVDAARYHRPCDRRRYQAVLGTDPERRHIGMVAQFIPRKGHRHLLRILPAVLSAHPDVDFVLFGQGPLWPEIKSEIEQLGLAQRVRLPGYVPDLEALLPGLYALVHPVLQEGLGVSLMQAAAAGVPAIASRAGGVPEIVRHADSGLLIDAGDSAALEQALHTLLQDRALRARLSAGARRLATTEFSVQRMVEGNLAVYRKLLLPAAGARIIPDS